MALIEAGTYRAKAVQGVLGLTQGGKEQVAVLFELVGAAQRLTWYGYFTEKTTESTFKALRTAGWKGQDLSDLSDLSSPDVPEVDLVVEHEPDQQGTVRAKVRWVNSTGGMGLSAPLEVNKAKAFAAKMKGKLAAFDRSAGAPKQQTKANPKRPPSSAQPPQEVLDAQEAEQVSDDVPF